MSTSEVDMAKDNVKPYGYVWFTKHMEQRFTRMKPHPEMGAMFIEPIYKFNELVFINNDEIIERAKQEKDSEVFYRGAKWAQAKLREKNT
jgi:hypothetical protein